jgi:hypothetical protein
MDVPSRSTCCDSCGILCKAQGHVKHNSPAAQYLCQCTPLQAVLDDMLLELLPPVARLAGSSAEGDRLLSAFCGLAAAACAPRDTITAFLEVLDDLVQGRYCMLCCHEVPLVCPALPINTAGQPAPGGMS